MLLLQGFHNELLNRRVSAEFIISQQMGTAVTETEPRTHAGHQQSLLTGRALHRGRLSCVLMASSREQGSGLSRQLAGVFSGSELPTKGRGVHLTTGTCHTPARVLPTRSTTRIF